MITPATMILLTLNVTIKICYHNSGILASLRYKEIRKQGLQISQTKSEFDAKNIDQNRAIKSWALPALNQSRFYRCNIQTTT